MENEVLVLDLLEWLNGSPKPYSEVMDAWRTTCPRLTVWEDATTAGYVSVRSGQVEITAQGRSYLESGRPATLGTESGLDG